MILLKKLKKKKNRVLTQKDVNTPKEARQGLPSKLDLQELDLNWWFLDKMEVVI